MTKRITTITELEEMVWDLVALSHTVGRMETDGVASQSKYDKLVDKRDDLRNKIALLFFLFTHKKFKRHEKEIFLFSANIFNFIGSYATTNS